MNQSLPASDKIFHRLLISCLAEQRMPTESEVDLIASKIWHERQGRRTGQEWSDVARCSNAYRQMTNASLMAFGSTVGKSLPELNSKPQHPVGGNAVRGIGDLERRALTLGNRAIGKAISDHRRQCFFGTPAYSDVLDLQIMPKPMRGALYHPQNRSCRLFVHDRGYAFGTVAAQ